MVRSLLLGGLILLGPVVLGAGSGGTVRARDDLGQQVWEVSESSIRAAPATIDDFIVQGTIVRVDGGGCDPPTACGGVYLVDPDGSQTLLSDSSNPAQGPISGTPTAIELESPASALVLFQQSNSAAIARVDLASGQRTLLTTLDEPQLGVPVGSLSESGSLALALDGAVYLGTEKTGSGPGELPSRLLRIDPVTGYREEIQNFQDPTQGTAQTSSDPAAILVEPDGTVIVVNAGADNAFQPHAYIYAVNPVSKQRTVLSDFNNVAQGPVIEMSLGIAGATFDANGDILVAAVDHRGPGGSPDSWSIWRVNRQTGFRTLLKNLNVTPYGTIYPTALRTSESGRLLLAGAYGGNPAQFHGIWEVNPQNGDLQTIGTYLRPADGTGSNDLAVLPSRLLPGTIAAIDYGGAISDRGRMFYIDPSSGQRIVISDFANPAQGPLGYNPWSLAQESDGNFIVLDRDAGLDCFGNGFGCGALFRINSKTGQRTLLSDLGNSAQGAVSYDGWSVDIGPNGAIYVNDFSGLILKVDPNSGQKTVLSDWNDSNLGPTGGRPSSIAFLPEGRMLSLDVYQHRLFEVDPASGNRTTLIADFLAGSPLVFAPISMVAGRGKIFIVDQIGDSCGLCWYGAIIEVDPNGWDYGTLSDFTVPFQGEIGYNLSDVALGPPGLLYVVDFDRGTNGRGVLHRVDECSGVRTPLSDFGDPSQGPVGDEPQEIVVVGGGSQASGTSCVNVEISGTGSGRVASQPASIDCPGVCGGRFDALVALDAFADVGSIFAGWSGDPDCSDGLVVTEGITMPKKCIATFNQQSFSLDVVVAGTGAGSVTSSPVGIVCGADCTEVVPANQEVELTAAAGQNSVFTGWSGSATGTANPLLINVNGAKAVTATFEPVPDQAAAAITASGVASSFVFNNAGATSSPLDPPLSGPGCGGTGGMARTVWFTLTAATGDVVRVSTTGSAITAAAGVFTGTGSGAAQLACSDGSGWAAVHVGQGQQIWIQVGTWSENMSGNVRVMIERFSANDANCDFEDTSLDALSILGILAGTHEVPAGCPADPDGDGVLSLADALRVRRHLVGLP